VPERKSTSTRYLKHEYRGLPSREMPPQLNLRQPRRPSWAERHHVAIGSGLTVVGIAAVGAIKLFGVQGSFATLLAAFAAFSFFFVEGFVRSRGPIFPSSEINHQNRWKYLIPAVSLWVRCLSSTGTGFDPFRGECSNLQRAWGGRSRASLAPARRILRARQLSRHNCRA
jgi:hypothetical protein